MSNRGLHGSKIDEYVSVLLEMSWAHEIAVDGLPVHLCLQVKRISEKASYTVTVYDESSVSSSVAP